MLFSFEWLLELCPLAADAAEVADALTARGLTVDAVVGDGAETALDVDVPANRPDCLGHLGLARELSAAFGMPLAPPPSAPDGAGAPTEGAVRVEIEDPADCPRYTAGLVRGISIAPSPDWVVRRLERCGLRSVSNAVDASNLVLLELGHPIHFFDYQRLGGASAGKPPLIRVRLARHDETLKTLDGQNRSLDEETLLIANGSGPLALAGVIGGADSEIGDATRDVLVEAARFRPTSVRRTARRLGVQTDASYRFERGVDAETAGRAQQLAARLLADLAGGRPAPGIVDCHPAPEAPRSLQLHAASLERLLGYRPSAEHTRSALSALGLLPQPGDGGTITVTVPSFRPDLRREADLVEEVARHLGYDQIPTSVIVDGSAATTGYLSSIERAAGEAMAAQGFQEAVGYSMIAAGEDDLFVADDTAAPLSLENPIAAPMALLRRSVLPGVVRAAELNLRRGTRDVRLFEVGKVFLRSERTDGFPDEPLRLGLICSGAALAEHWSAESRETDVFDLVGLVEHLLHGLRPGLTARREPGSHAAFHPGQSLHWVGPDGSSIAWGGRLHPEIADASGLDAFAAEIDLDRVEAVADPPPQHRRIPRLPAVTRDLAVVLGPSIPFARVLEVLGGVAAPAPATFAAVDRYQGPPLAADEAAVTVRVRLQPTEKTLTDPETEGYRQQLAAALEQELGVRLRG